MQDHRDVGDLHAMQSREVVPVHRDVRALRPGVVRIGPPEGSIGQSRAVSGPGSHLSEVIRPVVGEGKLAIGDHPTRVLSLLAGETGSGRYLPLLGVREVTSFDEFDPFGANDGVCGGKWHHRCQGEDEEEDNRNTSGPPHVQTTVECRASIRWSSVHPCKHA